MVPYKVAEGRSYKLWTSIPMLNDGFFVTPDETIFVLDREIILVLGDSDVPAVRHFTKVLSVRSRKIGYTGAYGKWDVNEIIENDS